MQKGKDMFHCFVFLWRANTIKQDDVSRTIFFIVTTIPVKLIPSNENIVTLTNAKAETAMQCTFEDTLYFFIQAIVDKLFTDSINKII